MRFAAFIAALVVSATTALADPVGIYDVTGSSPDGGTYSGTATVRKTGETCEVVWVMGKDRFVGSAVGNEEFMAVTYRSTCSTGIAAYGSEGPDWIGVWTYPGGRQIGAERWIRR